MDDPMRTSGTTDPVNDTSDRPSNNPAVTAPIGAAAGAVAGATAGTLTAGPIGTIIGALVGAVGGGWAGLASSDLAAPTAEDEAYYQSHYARASAGLADASYDRARPAYHLGHAAAWNPDYRGRTFEQVEPDLRRAWTDDARARYGDWASVRPYAMAGYERGTERALGDTMVTLPPPVVPADEMVGGGESPRRPEYNDPVPPSEL